MPDIYLATYSSIGVSWKQRTRLHWVRSKRERRCNASFLTHSKTSSQYLVCLRVNIYGFTITEMISQNNRWVARPAVSQNIRGQEACFIGWVLFLRPPLVQVAGNCNKITPICHIIIVFCSKMEYDIDIVANRQQVAKCLNNNNNNSHETGIFTLSNCRFTCFIRKTRNNNKRDYFSNNGKITASKYSQCRL